MLCTYMAIPILIRVTFTYRITALFCVALLPVRRPISRIDLTVSRLERPSVVANAPTCFPREAIHLIVPDSTIVAAMLGGRVTPLRLVLSLPGMLVSMIRVGANARTRTELRNVVFFVSLANLSIISARITVWGDLAPLLPMPGQLKQTMGVGVAHANLDLSIQDLPRLVLFRMGERSDLTVLVLLYAVFVSRIVYDSRSVGDKMNRWGYRCIVFVAAVYVLGGDGRADIVTRIAVLVVRELFLFCRITLSVRQRYRDNI